MAPAGCNGPCYQLNMQISLSIGCTDLDVDESEELRRSPHRSSRVKQVEEWLRIHRGGLWWGQGSWQDRPLEPMPATANGERGHKGQVIFKEEGQRRIVSQSGHSNLHSWIAWMLPSHSYNITSLATWHSSRIRPDSMGFSATLKRFS